MYQEMSRFSSGKSSWQP